MYARVFGEQITVVGPGLISVGQLLTVTRHSHDNSEREGVISLPPDPTLSAPPQPLHINSFSVSPHFFLCVCFINEELLYNQSVWLPCFTHRYVKI